MPGPSVQSIETTNSNGKKTTKYYEGYKSNKNYNNHMLEVNKESKKRELQRERIPNTNSNSLFRDIDYVEKDTTASLLDLFAPDSNSVIQSLDEYDTQIFSDEFQQVYRLIEKLPSKEETSTKEPIVLNKRLEKLTYILYMIRKRMNKRIHGKATRVHPKAKVLSLQQYYESYGVISKSVNGDNFNLILSSTDKTQLENLDYLLQMLLPYSKTEPPKKSFFNRLKNTLKFKG